MRVRLAHRPPGRLDAYDQPSRTITTASSRYYAAWRGVATQPAAALRARVLRHLGKNCRKLQQTATDARTPLSGFVRNECLSMLLCLNVMV